MGDAVNTNRLQHMMAVEQDRDWIHKLPYLKFPRGWQIKAIPPIGFAVVRYWLINNHGAMVSIYFDAYEALGCFGGPHWEIYPGPSGENERFAFGDEASMLKAVAKVKP